MIIYVDDRKGSAELAPKIRKMGPEVKLGRYNSADMWFWGVGPQDTNVKIGIERKTITDLIDSIRTERLLGEKGQYDKLVQDYQRVYLVVEGITRLNEDGFLEMLSSRGQWIRVYGDNKRTPVLGAQIDNFLNTVLEFTELRVIRTSTPKETAAWCVSTYNWWNKDYESHSSHKGVYRGALDTTAMITRDRHTPFSALMLMNVKMLGREKAMEARDLFGSVESMMDVSEKTWMTTIGPTLGKRIYQKLRER